MTIMEDVSICTPSMKLLFVLRFAISPAVTTAKAITIVGATTITIARARGLTTAGTLGTTTFVFVIIAARSQD